MVIEYGSYECPFCAKADGLLAARRCRRVFRHFPVASKHPRARALAHAAEAAALQGRFWEMHDSLMADQSQLDDPHLWQRCEQLGLDLDRFESDRRSAAVADRVERDFRSGIRAGVTTTPTLFVDGRAHPGVPGASCCPVRRTERKLCSSACVEGRHMMQALALAAIRGSPVPVRRGGARVRRRAALYARSRRPKRRAQSCIDRALAGAGVAPRIRHPRPPARHRAAVGGRRRLGPGRVRGATGKRVAGSAFWGSDEIAQGFAGRAARSSSVQACRRSGAADSASSRWSTRPSRGRTPETISLVKVSTPNAARKEELSSLGLDLTEHGGRGFVEVVLHGDADTRALREHKFTYMTSIADLAARSARDSAADRRLRQSVSASALPSGRAAGYRRLADYNNEMKKLAADNPGIVKPITLPLKTLTGYSVQGIEISSGVSAATASRCSCRWAPTTPASGRPPSTRWSGRTSWSTATRRRTLACGG